MNLNLKEKAHHIIKETIEEIKPEKLLIQKLKDLEFYKILKTKEKLFIISLGKAGFSMAISLYNYLKENHLENKIIKGFVVTPYKTKKHEIPDFEIIESSHPYPDENSIYAGNRIFKVINSISENSTVLFLLSGGASSLIEKSIVDLENLQALTKQLLNSGADIKEINIIRKKLSYIKGGGLGNALFPREIYQFLLCDVVGENSEPFVSSGPLYPDFTTKEEVLEIFKKYEIKWDKELIFPENKTSLKETYVIGNNKIACSKLKKVLEKYHWESIIKITDFSGPIQNYESVIYQDILNINFDKPIAFIWGGEPTIKITGTGKGGRNQELCLRIAYRLFNSHLFKENNFLFCSFGTDGLDGPTDAAGGIIDYSSFQRINDILPNTPLPYKNALEMLENNDSYSALQMIDSLLFLGPTGTNLNDLSFCLYNP